MFHPMKPETIARRAHRQEMERNAQRWAFERNVEHAKRDYPQFPYPASLPVENVLWLEAGEPGPKGYPEAIAVSATCVKYEAAF